MRDYEITAQCRSGHKWQQHITADPHGQDSVTFESEELCPKCGLCSTDCMGCEFCEPPVRGRGLSMDRVFSVLAECAEREREFFAAGRLGQS